LALELEKQLAIEAKKKEAERKSTLEKIEKSSLPVVRAAEQAAAMVSANPHYVTDAKKVKQDAPEILEQVKQGKLSIPRADTVAPSLTDRLLTPSL
jgi:membrane-bound lytic murein transglycosylase MltF